MGTPRTSQGAYLQVLGLNLCGSSHGVRDGDWLADLPLRDWNEPKRAAGARQLWRAAAVHGAEHVDQGDGAVAVSVPGIEELIDVCAPGRATRGAECRSELAARAAAVDVVRERAEQGDYACALTREHLTQRVNHRRSGGRRERHTQLGGRLPHRRLPPCSAHRLATCEPAARGVLLPHGRWHHPSPIQSLRSDLSELLRRAKLPASATAAASRAVASSARR